MYSLSCLRPHDPDNAWVERVLQEWRVDENIAFAVNRVFSSSLYWPLDPYRTMLHVLRRKERDPDLVLGDPFHSPRDSLDLKGHIIRSTTFRPLPLCGQAYLALLISSASTRRAEELLAEFRDLTGGLPASLVSNGIRAQYVEALHISSCMTGSVRSHRPHVHEAVVEASLAGEDLDACLLLFIRRVLEEGARAEAAAPLIAPYILVYMRESVSSSDVAKPPLSFAPNEMQSARRQVFLSSMKAAIVGGGSVWLQCFYYTEHAVPPMRDESQHLSQTTAGYVLLRRRYAFTFIDTRLDSVKCFCRNPYESLALCIFQSNADAQTVRQNFLAHCEREGAGGAAMRCSVIQFVRDQSVRAVRQLDAGELALFGETLLPLIAHSAPDIHAMPQAGARLSSLCVGPAGFLRMVRDSVQHVEAVVKYLLQEIKSVGLLSLRQERNLWSETAAEQARRLEHGVTTVPAALQEVRLLVTAAWRDIESSEKSTVQNFVIAQLRCIAELSQRRKHRLAAAVQSMVSGTAAVARVTEFVGHGYLVAVNSSWLHAVSIPLHHISSALLMLEATLAADTLSELLQLDADPQAHLFKSNVQELMVASAIPMDPGPHLFIDKRPSSVSELIGALAKIADVKDLDQMQEWTPFNFQSFAYGQFVRPQGPLNPLPLIGSAQARIRFRPNEEHLCDEEETYVLDTDAEEIAYCLDPAQVYRAHDRAYGLHGALVSRFLRVYGSLGVCWRGRLGAVDAVAALLDEVHRYESPRGIAEEAARSRHLIVTRALSALNTGVRSIIFSPDRANPYSVLSRALYPHSAQLQLWRHSNEEIQRRFPLYVSSQRVGVENLSDDIEYPNLSGPHRYGYFKLSLESPRSRKTQQTLSQKEFSSLFLRGGLFGPMELLRALGCWRQVYLSAWLLPPVVTCGNFQVKGDGLAIETLCGVSGETALSWGTPRMALVEARERDRRFTDDPNKPACTGDADLWASEPQRKMYIEIVIKVTKDRQRSADVARELFAEEVIRAVAAVAAHSRWIIHELSVDDCCSDNEKEFSGERLIVYPLAKVAVSERGGLPKWASHSFMTALRVRGEAMAECAVLMGQEVDTGAPEASHFQPSTQSGAMSANESGIIAQQLEANMPLESVPSMFPALLESFKSICGMAKQRERTSERSERPVADKWWGGGEGWRGTDSDAAHDMDPTAREAHRSNVFSAATHRVQAAVGMREDIPRVYVPCQLRFSLLCFTSSEKCTDLDESEAVNSVGESAATNSDAPTAVKLNKMSTIFMRAANKAKLVSNMTDTSQGLAIGAGRVISRLIGSTVWLSTDAAVAVWSCLPLNESISIDKHAKLVKAVIAAESKAQLQEAHKLYRQHPSDYIRAYQHAGLSLSLSADINSFQRLFPDVVRMNESLASRARALADTLRMLRQILDRPRSGAGECLELTNLDALSATLVIHVSLSVRLLVASPQCVHLVGGMYPVLLLVFKLETNFQLGHYSLNTGMRFGCDGMHESGSAWKLPLPTIDRETQAEMIEKRVSIDGSTGIRRAIAVGGDALEQLVDIILSLEGMCSLIADALAEDVHCCSRDSIGDFISSSSFKEEPISQTLNLGQLMKRMDKKGVVQKKVAFIEPIKIDNAEVKVSESKSLEPDEEFEVRSTAFLSAIQESLMLPTEREVKDRLEPNIAEEDGTPSVLVGRMRRPLPQGKIYGPNAITMLDDLRNMQSRK